jgi:endonuclease/exonuclease/phosphatase family metal-dependent hydrolase
VGAVAVISWGWLLPSLRTIGASDTARGVVFGLLLDLALRFLLGTVDLPWMPDLTRHLITIALVTMLVIATSVVLIAGRERCAAAGPALLGVGPGLVIFHLASGNLGVVQVKSSLPAEAAVWLLGIGLAAGFTMSIRPVDPIGARRPLPSGWANTAALTVLGLLGLLLFWRWNGAFDVAAVLMAAVGAQLLLLAVRGRDSGEPTRFGDALWLTAGMLLHAGLVFAYYTATGLPVLIAVAFGLLGAGAALSTRRRAQLPEIPPARYMPAMLVLSALLLVGGLFANRDFWDGVDREDVLGRELTVMTYNLQTGFSRDNVWDLEAQAKVIESYDPDVVILQETSRGWVITSAVDQVRWLSNRLDMNMVWGPSANDDLWGVAILTKGKVLASDMRMFDATNNLRRGVLGAVVPIEGGQLWLYATHLDNPEDAENVRLAQAAQLLEVADGSPAIAGGDFNATPETETIGAMLAAGFVDTGAGPNRPTSEDDRRIDYIFARGSFRVVEAITPDVWVSDHRPFIARLILED